MIDSARAVKAQDPARLRFDARARADEVVPAPGAGPDARARADEVVPAPGAGPDVRRFTDSPVTLGLSGALSPEAIEAEGSAGFGGQTFTAQALAGARELYVRFLGSWYGTREIGLAQLRQQAEQQGGRSSDQAFNEAIASIERYGDQVFEGEVTEGPELDGAATWQTEGTLNAEGLAQIARQQGEQVTSQDREVLEKITQGTRLTYVVGQEDKLPRRLQLAFDLRPAELAASAEENDEDLEQVERVRASFTVNMSAWGEPVEIRPPSNFQPIEQLAQRFLGGALGGGLTPQPQQ